MNIIVFDVAAEHGGALTILNEFYNYVKNNPTPNVKWTFILSTPCLESTEHVNVKNYPWVKKSWFHRLYFDYFVAPKLVKDFKSDKIFSLQNICIPKTDIPQILYVHQPLPFSEIKFSIFENYKFWIYQNVVSKLIINSIKKSIFVIVQTNWMKAAIKALSGKKDTDILVCPPTLDILVNHKFIDCKENRKLFFYPASAIVYKNHRVIIDACRILKKRNIDVKVIFTIEEKTNSLAVKLKKLCALYDLDINFIGNISREEVMSLYSRSILIFPSKLETFGLPLLEAMYCNCPIIASDLNYSHEVLQDYFNAEYFNSNNAAELADLMHMFMNDRPVKSYSSQKSNRNDILSWEKIISLICDNSI